MTNNRYETMRNMTLLPKFINIDNYKGKLCTQTNVYMSFCTCLLTGY